MISSQNKENRDFTISELLLGCFSFWIGFAIGLKDMNGIIFGLIGWIILLIFIIRSNIK